MEKGFEDKRSEPRTIVDQYYSVEFSVKDIDSVYQFRIWNTSAKGICVLVKDGSALLKYLKVGDVLNMKYYKTDSPESSDTINQHTSKVACVTCHVPEFARGGRKTKMWWDWSTAGRKDEKGKPMVNKDADGYDVEPLVTLESKRKTLTRAAEGGWWLAFEHDPFVAWGRAAVPAGGEAGCVLEDVREQVLVPGAVRGQ